MLFCLSTRSRLLDTLVLLLLLLNLLTFPAKAGAYELYGPKWFSNWRFQIDDACNNTIQETILESAQALSSIFALDHTSTSISSGGAYDHSNQFYCSEDFSRQLVVTPPGISYTTFDLQSAVGNATLGRAHLWWIESEIVEVDIQLSPTLDGWLLRNTIDHEILHGLGCEHSDLEAALMYPVVDQDKGHHYDDFLCLHSLYGIRHALVDYQGNVFVPDARKLGGPESFWGVLKTPAVIDSGLNENE